MLPVLWNRWKSTELNNAVSLAVTGQVLIWGNSQSSKTFFKPRGSETATWTPYNGWLFGVYLLLEKSSKGKASSNRFLLSVCCGLDLNIKCCVVLRFVVLCCVVLCCVVVWPPSQGRPWENPSHVLTSRRSRGSWKQFIKLFLLQQSRSVLGRRPRSHSTFGPCLSTEWTNKLKSPQDRKTCWMKSSCVSSTTHGGFRPKLSKCVCTI